MVRIFLLKNLTATNKTHVPLTKNNNKILFYIKKQINKGMVAIPLGVAGPPQLGGGVALV
jgi:hypothetical protein